MEFSHSCRSSSSPDRRTPCTKQNVYTEWTNTSREKYFNISRVSFSLSSPSNLYNFYLFTFVCVLVYTPECVTVCVCTYSYGMALKTRWSSSVSCSAISKAEWLSNGSVLESSMAWPQQQAEKSITTTKAKKKKGFILKRLFCGLFSPFVWSLRGWPGCLQDPPGLEFYTKEDITVIWSLIHVFFPNNSITLT